MTFTDLNTLAKSFVEKGCRQMDPDIEDLAGLVEDTGGAGCCEDVSVAFVAPSVAEAQASSGQSALRISLRRVVVIEASGSADEYVWYILTNPGATEIPLDAVRFTWTDPGDCNVERVICGRGAPTEAWTFGYSPDRSKFAIGVAPSLSVPPKGTLEVGVHVRRAKLLNRIGDGLNLYSDPLLPASTLLDARVSLVLAEPVDIEADGFHQRGPRSVTWLTTVGSAQVAISATFRRANNAHHDEHAAQVLDEVAAMFD